MNSLGDKMFELQQLSQDKKYIYLRLLKWRTVFMHISNAQWLSKTKRSHRRSGCDWKYHNIQSHSTIWKIQIQLSSVAAKMTMPTVCHIVIEGIVDCHVKNIFWHTIFQLCGIQILKLALRKSQKVVPICFQLSRKMLLNIFSNLFFNQHGFRLPILLCSERTNVRITH